MEGVYGWENTEKEKEFRKWIINGQFYIIFYFIKKSDFNMYIFPFL